MSDSSDCPNTEDGLKRGFLKKRAKELALLTGVAGMSICFGFGFTIALAKKKDPNMFNKGLIGSRGIPDSGGSLALRALGWGTLYSVTGVGVLCFGVWKLMGVRNMEEFTAKMQSVIPKGPKNPNPGKSDFKTVRELFDYIIEEDKNKKSKGS